VQSHKSKWLILVGILFIAGIAGLYFAMKPSWAGYAKAVGQPFALTGAPLPAEPEQASWRLYRNGSGGYLFRYPAKWRYILQSDYKAVRMLAERASGNNDPGAEVLVFFITSPSSRTNANMSGNPSVVKEITVGKGNYKAYRYDDTVMRIPQHYSYAEIPHRGGRLCFMATKGPHVDVSQQLDEILKTVELFGDTEAKK